MKQVTYEINHSFNLSKRLQRFKYPCGDCSPESPMKNKRRAHLKSVKTDNAQIAAHEVSDGTPSPTAFDGPRR